MQRCTLPAFAPPSPLAGMWTVRYFKSKQYNWSGISQQPSLLAKAKRGIMQVGGGILGERPVWSICHRCIAGKSSTKYTVGRDASTKGFFIFTAQHSSTRNGNATCTCTAHPPPACPRSSRPTPGTTLSGRSSPAPSDACRWVWGCRLRGGSPSWLLLPPAVRPAAL